MSHFINAKRNGLWDNIAGAAACAGTTSIIHGLPVFHNSCALTRVDPTYYLWSCVFPNFTLLALMVASVVLPVVSWIIGRLSPRAPMGFAFVSLCFGISLMLISFFVATEFTLPACFAGVIAGLIFTVTRDHAYWFFQAGRAFRGNSNA